MTFKSYYLALGLRAFFARDRATHDEIARLRDVIKEKDDTIEFHRRKLTDAMMVTASGAPQWQNTAFEASSFGRFSSCGCIRDKIPRFVRHT